MCVHVHEQPGAVSLYAQSHAFTSGEYRLALGAFRSVFLDTLGMVHGTMCNTLWTWYMVYCAMHTLGTLQGAIQIHRTAAEQSRTLAGAAVGGLRRPDRHSGLRHAGNLGLALRQVRSGAPHRNQPHPRRHYPAGGVLCVHKNVPGANLDGVAACTPLLPLLLLNRNTTVRAHVT